MQLNPNPTPDPDPNPSPNPNPNPNHPPNPSLKKRTAEMRVELVQAKAQVCEMEQVVRKAERRVDVCRIDKAEMNKSLVIHVGKIDSLVVLARQYRPKRAELQADHNGSLRRFKHRTEVSVAVTLFPFV